MVRYTGGQRWPRKSESGRVPEWPMGTDCKSAAFQLRWFESTRAHQKSSTHERALSFLFCNKARLIERVDSNSSGADRRLWRKQGGEAGAAASRMRAAEKQTLGAATRAPYHERGLRNPPAPTKKAQPMNRRKRGRMAAEKEKSTSILNGSTCHFGRSSGI